MGTNNLSTKSGGDVIAADDPNQYKEALGNNFVPRNSSGVPTDEGGNVGSATYKFLKGYIKELIVGAIANQLEIKEDSGSLAIYVGGSKVGEFDSSGFLGSFIKNGTVDTDQLADLSITTAKIAAGAVGNQEIGNGEITTAKLSDYLITKRKLATDFIEQATIPTGETITTSWTTIASITQAYNGSHGIIFGICQSGATDFYLFACTTDYDLRLIDSASNVLWQKNLSSGNSTFEHPIIGIGNAAGSPAETFSFQAKASVGSPTLTATDANIFLI